MEVPRADSMEESSSSMERARIVLRRYWGYPDFRPGQREVIASVLQGRDVVGILPTGGGKSLCYQVPALAMNRLALVVSPLIALMEDQVAHLNARGVPAAFINSTLSMREVDQRWTDAEYGRYRLLYVAPERLLTDMFLARAERLKVGLLAVDEAHCISEWGHHFRPAYLQIAEARDRLGDPPVIAVTATATPQVRRDIVEHLKLHDPRVIVKGFDRPNLVWSVFRTENKRDQVRRVLAGVPGSGIIYAATRRNVEEWADWLSQENTTVTTYHGGMRPEARARAQQAWIQGAARVVVATNAFGMGIDKPDVRFVIHVDIPGSLEAYYQEAGRGGRDGKRAYAILCFHPSDEATQRSLIEEGHPDARAVRRIYDAACNLGQVAVGTLPDGPLTLNVETVARLAGCPEGRIRTAIELLERQGVWQTLPIRRHQGLIRFRQPADAIRRYAAGLSNRALAEFVRALLRTVHADAFSAWWEIDLRLLQRSTGLERDRLLRGLALLEERDLLRWQAPGSALRIQFLEPRSGRLAVDDVAVRRARRRAEARLADMLRYARSVTCRRHFLLSYFGERSPERCGTCDVCLGRHEPVEITPEQEPVMRHILHQVARGIPREAWFDTPTRPAHEIDGLVDWLVQEAYLHVVDPLEQEFEVTDKANELLDQWYPRATKDGS